MHCHRNSECFVAGTPVWTDKGLVSIEQIQVGDFVLSRCEKTGEQTYKRVSRTFRTEAQEIRAIAAEGPLNPDGSDFIVEYIFATPEHPIWVNNHGWLPVKELLDCWQKYDIWHWSFARADGRQASFFPEISTVGYPLFEANQACFLYQLSTVSDSSLAGSKGAFVRMRGGDEDPGFTLIFDGNRFDDNYDPAERGSLDTPDNTRAAYHGARPVGDFVDGLSHGPNLFKTTVYNIEVEDFHTYFVGDLGLWVHNACTVVDSIAADAAIASRSTRNK
jgi:hypothetical protein